MKDGWGMLNQKDGTTYAGQWVSGRAWSCVRTAYFGCKDGASTPESGRKGGGHVTYMAMVY